MNCRILLCSSARAAAKTRHAFEKRSKRYFLYLAKSGAALWTAISVPDEMRPELAACKTLANEFQRSRAMQEPLRDGGPARTRVFPRAAREGYLRARAASAPRPRDLDRRVRSRVCRARAGSRAGPQGTGLARGLPAAARRLNFKLKFNLAWSAASANGPPLSATSRRGSRGRPRRVLPWTAGSFPSPAGPRPRPSAGSAGSGPAGPPSRRGSWQS